MKVIEIAKAGELRNTVSLKAQAVLTKLLDAVSIYNIDISCKMIMVDVVENIDDRFFSVFDEYNSSVPCPLDYYVDRRCEAISSKEDIAKFRELMDCDRLMKAYADGVLEHSAEYEITLGDGKIHSIFHKMILTEDIESGHIIARCSTRDVSKLVDIGKRLNKAQDKIDLSFVVMESLIKDCSVIWTVNREERNIELFRILEHGYLPSTFDAGIGELTYDNIIASYVNEYVVENERNRVLQEANLDHMMRMVEDGGIYKVNYQKIESNGETTYNQLIFTKAKADNAKYVLAFKDVNDIRKREIEELQRQKRLERFEADSQAMDLIHESLGAGSFRIDFDKDCEITSLHWSDMLKAMLGYGGDDDFRNVFESLTDLIHGEDRNAAMELFERAVKDVTGKVVFDTEFRLFTKKGGYRWFHVASRVSRRIDGSPVTMMGLITDIDESKKASEIVAEQFGIVKALSKDFLNVYKVNPIERTAQIIKIEGYRTHGVNDNETIYSYDALLRQYIRDRVYPDDQAMMHELLKLENVTAKLDENPSYESGYRVIENGEIHFFQFMYIKMPLGTGGYQIIAGFKNVDEIVKAAKERESLIILSETDQMTGILNRGSGEKKTEQLIAKHKAGMLCILDVDKFKSINDTYGHAIGDKVIVSVAHCLKETFRERDIVFRLGGDEFAVYAVGDIAFKDAEKMFERFFKKLEQIDIPEIGDRKITASVGVIIVDENNSFMFEELYKAADGCVYTSKKHVGNRVTYFNGSKQSEDDE